MSKRDRKVVSLELISSAELVYEQAKDLQSMHTLSGYICLITHVNCNLATFWLCHGMFYGENFVTRIIAADTSQAILV